MTSNKDMSIRPRQQVASSSLNTENPELGGVDKVSQATRQMMKRSAEESDGRTLQTFQRVDVEDSTNQTKKVRFNQNEEEPYEADLSDQLVHLTIKNEADLSDLLVHLNIDKKEKEQLLDIIKNNFPWKKLNKEGLDLLVKAIDNGFRFDKLLPQQMQQKIDRAKSWLKFGEDLGSLSTIKRVVFFIKYDKYIHKKNCHLLNKYGIFFGKLPESKIYITTVLMDSFTDTEKLEKDIQTALPLLLRYEGDDRLVILNAILDKHNINTLSEIVQILMKNSISEPAKTIVEDFNKLSAQNKFQLEIKLLLLNQLPSSRSPVDMRMYIHMSPPDLKMLIPYASVPPSIEELEEKWHQEDIPLDVPYAFSLPPSIEELEEKWHQEDIPLDVIRVAIAGLKVAQPGGITAYSLLLDIIEKSFLKIKNSKYRKFVDVDYLISKIRRLIPHEQQVLFDCAELLLHKIEDVDGKFFMLEKLIFFLEQNYASQMKAALHDCLAVLEGEDFKDLGQVRNVMKEFINIRRNKNFCEAICTTLIAGAKPFLSIVPTRNKANIIAVLQPEKNNSNIFCPYEEYKLHMEQLKIFEPIILEKMRSSQCPAELFFIFTNTIDSRSKTFANRPLAEMLFEFEEFEMRMGPGSHQAFAPLFFALPISYRYELYQLVKNEFPLDTVDIESLELLIKKLASLFEKGTERIDSLVQEAKSWQQKEGTNNPPSLISLWESLKESKTRPFRKLGANEIHSLAIRFLVQEAKSWLQEKDTNYRNNPASVLSLLCSLEDSQTSSYLKSETGQLFKKYEILSGEPSNYLITEGIKILEKKPLEKREEFLINILPLLIRFSGNDRLDILNEALAADRDDSLTLYVSILLKNSLNTPVGILLQQSKSLLKENREQLKTRLSLLNNLSPSYPPHLLTKLIDSPLTSINPWGNPHG